MTTRKILFNSYVGSVGLLTVKLEGIVFGFKRNAINLTHQEYKRTPSAATDGSGSSIFVVVATIENTASTSL